MSFSPLLVLLLDTQIRAVSKQQVTASLKGAEQTDLGSNAHSSSNYEIFHF